MKQTVIIIGSLILALNLLFGLLLSSYQTFNMLLNCGVIILNTLILLWIGDMEMKDGYKISYYVLFPLLSMMEVYVVAIAPQRWEDNVALLFVMLLLAFQITMLIISHYVSKIS